MTLRYLLLAAFLATAPLANAAFDPPHGNTCSVCHISFGTPNSPHNSSAGNPNLCLSCHNPASLASALSFVPGENADPFATLTGNWHSVQVSAVNASAGAEVPLNTEMSSRQPDGQLICSTCHDQHNQTFPPYLRASNAFDAMCQDCHRSRALGTWRDDPAANIGSHPVNVTIPASPEFRTPQDGETYLPLQSGLVECTTCHAVHFAGSAVTRQFHATGGTSQSVTVTGASWAPNAFAGWEVVFPAPGANLRKRRTIASNTSDTVTWAESLPAAVGMGDVFVLQELGIGDGNLLRSVNDETLCKTCHTFPDHPVSNPTKSCRDCHDPHGTPNALLVAANIDGRDVSFDGLGGDDFTHGAPNYDGVCEVCHTQTAYHRNNPSGDHTHMAGQVCTECHHHDSGFRAECSQCHAATTNTLTTGSHPAHFLDANGPHIADCTTCHGPGADKGTHAGHRDGMVTFVGSTTLANTAACDACHSPDGFVNGVAEAKGAWATGVYQSPGVLAQSHQQWCAGCHDDDPTTPSSNESAVVEGVFAQPELGDNSSFGYYVTGHGREGMTYPAMSWQPTNGPGNPAGALGCESCHDSASVHIDGIANGGDRLKDGFIPDQANGACTVCHQDAGPANHSPVYFVNGGAFEASAHAGQLCTVCHNPHGTANPAMSPLNQEALCYQCHSATQAKFGLSTHHDVSATDQAQHSSRVECTMCHNPHLSTAPQPLVNPDNVTEVWADSTPREFCVACHDGAPPAAVSMPTATTGSGMNQSTFRGSRHDVTLGGDCTLCHDAHGSANRATLLANYTVADNTSASQAAYQLCFNCHSYSATVTNDNAFNEYHNKHVREERGPCIACHNAHGSYDPSESGLLDFSYATRVGIVTLNSGRTQSTAFTDNGTDRGSCYIRCHGEGHSPRSYTGIAASTVNCLQCHATQPREAAGNSSLSSPVELGGV